MKPKARNAGIDYFRLIAAFLVVAVHTSPLTSVDGTADFVLTRVVAGLRCHSFLWSRAFFFCPDI